MNGFNLMHALQSQQQQQQQHQQQQQQQYQWHLQQFLFGGGGSVRVPMDDHAAAVAALHQMHQQAAIPPVSMPSTTTTTAMTIGIAADSLARNDFTGSDSDDHEAVLLIRIVEQVGRNSSAPKSSLWDEVASKVSTALGRMRDAKTCMENFGNLSKLYRKLKQSKDKVNHPQFQELDDVFSLNQHRTDQSNLLLLIREAAEFALGNADVSCHPSSSESAAGGQREAEVPAWQASWKATKAHLEELVKKSLEMQEALQQEFLDRFDKRVEQQVSQHEATKKLQDSQEQLEVQAFKWRTNFGAGLTSWLSNIVTALEQQSVSVPSPSAFFNASDTNAAGQDNSQASVGKRCFWSDREVKELMNLRVEMDHVFCEAGKNKHMCWEDLSERMSKQGYSRSAKRCKEKWENVNKSFRSHKNSDKFPHAVLRDMYQQGRIRTVSRAAGSVSSEGGDTEPEVLMLMDPNPENCVKNHESWLSNNSNDSAATGNASSSGRKRSWGDELAFESLHEAASEHLMCKSRRCGDDQRPQSNFCG